MQRSREDVGLSDEVYLTCIGHELAGASLRLLATKVGDDGGLYCRVHHLFCWLVCWSTLRTNALYEFIADLAALATGFSTDSAMFMHVGMAFTLAATAVTDGLAGL